LFAQGRISKGGFSEAKEKDIVWFAIKELNDPIKNKEGKERLVEIMPPERSIPSYWKGIVEVNVSVLQGLKVRSAPNGDKGGAQVAPGQVLCTGSVICFDSDKIRWLMLEDGKKYPMAECTLVPSKNSGLKGAGTLPEKFWCCVDDVGPKKMVTKKSITPVDFESVVITNAAIRAGEPIGYMGLYEVPVNEKGGIQSKRQVHVEVFSSDSGLENFLKNPAGVIEGKKFLVLKQGQMLATKSGTDSAPVFTDQGPALNAKSYSVMEDSSIIKDSTGDEWLKVSILDVEKPQEGYVKKKSVEIICQHDWEKLGYTVLRESDSNADGFLDPESMPTFFKEIYSKVDASGTKDGVVTPAELQAALRDPNIRSAWSKFIAHHPTEWQAKSSESKWNRLKDLLKDSPELLKHEQERIDNLVFWDEMSGLMQVVLPKSVYHFHPLSFINSIMKFENPGKGWAHSAFANLLASVESNNDYTAYNKTKGGLQSFYKTNLTGLTIAELQQKQKDRSIFAAGRYQMVPDTIKGAIKTLGLSPSTKFDEATQDKIFEEYLIKVKRKAFIGFLEGDGDVEAAAYSWALEFASAGVRKGRKISSIAKRDKNNKIVMGADGVTPVMISRVASFEGQSYYAGDGLNTAHILPEKMVRALEESKKNGK